MLKPKLLLIDQSPEKIIPVLEKTKESHMISAFGLRLDNVLKNSGIALIDCLQ